MGLSRALIPAGAVLAWTALSSLLGADAGVGPPSKSPRIGGPAPSQDSSHAESDEHAAWEARLLDDGRRVDLEDRSENDCLRCHQAIGEEWAHSTHATAWQDEHYQKALKKIRRKQGCWGCHAPEPLAAAGYPEKPEVRELTRHLGVDCSTCHVAADGKTILGPAGHANSAHPSEAAEVFDESETNALCIACHATNIGPVIGVAKDFVDSDQAGFGSSCVDCHMPRARRPWAEPWEQGQEPFPVRPGRSHRLQTPRDPLFLATAFDLEAEATEDGAQLILTNLTGHRVPGLQERELTFELSLIDGTGEVSAEAERTFDYRAYLPVEGDAEIPIEGKGKLLRVKALHKAPGAKSPQVFIERDFQL